MIIWKVWTNAGTEAKARRVLDDVLDRLAVEADLQDVEPYSKLNGYVATLAVQTQAVRWADRVLEALLLGQRIGRSWLLTGAADESLSATTEASTVAGVVMIEWILERSA